jgi:hypothetical protein
VQLRPPRVPRHDDAAEPSEVTVPTGTTLRRARARRRRGDAPSTQAGEFVREEFHHARSGKHPVKSRKQAIAIGLSKARRAGVRLAVPKRGRASAATRRKARADLKAGRGRRA